MLKKKMESNLQNECNREWENATVFNVDKNNVQTGLNFIEEFQPQLMTIKTHTQLNLSDKEFKKDFLEIESFFEQREQQAYSLFTLS